MSIIVVSDIPPRLKVNQVMKLLLQPVNGKFKVVGTKLDQNKLKHIYLKLSPKLNPTVAVENINTRSKFSAHIPDQIPELSPKFKILELPQKLLMQFHIPSEAPPSQVLATSHNEILCEMQSKYTGLYNLSKKTGHKLLDSISRTVFERLKKILETNPEAIESEFRMTQRYRRAHPHFGDFQLVLSALHKLQDAAGVPRTEVLESALSAVSAQPFVLDNIPLNKLQSACYRYTDRIAKKINEHLTTLDCAPKSGDSEEEAAQKKVREQLVKLKPYLSQIIRQVITNHFLPDKAPFHRMRMYGEPVLPRMAAVAALVKRHRGVHLLRSDRMYNMARFSVPLHQYGSLVKHDQTVLGEAKLIIRPSDVPRYSVTSQLKKDIAAIFGKHVTDNIDVAEEQEIPDENEKMSDDELVED